MDPTRTSNEFRNTVRVYWSPRAKDSYEHNTYNTLQTRTLLKHVIDVAHREQKIETALTRWSVGTKLKAITSSCVTAAAQVLD